MSNPNPKCLSGLELLGGLTLGTVLHLKWSEGDDIMVTHSGPEDFGYYAGLITTQSGRLLVSSKHVFETPESAEGHMRSVINASRECSTVDLRLRLLAERNK